MRRFEGTDVYQGMQVESTPVHGVGQDSSGRGEVRQDHRQRLATSWAALELECSFRAVP